MPYVKHLNKVKSDVLAEGKAWGYASEILN